MLPNFLDIIIHFQMGWYHPHQIDLMEDLKNEADLLQPLNFDGKLDLAFSNCD